MQALLSPVRLRPRRRFDWLPERVRRRPCGGLLAVAALLLAAVAASAQTPVPQAPSVEPELLARAAEIAYRREITRPVPAGIRNTDPELIRRARYATKPLIGYVSRNFPEAANWDWAVNVVKRDEPIAVCLPAGKILISSGLFDRMRLTDHEFAAIVAHVIAHALSGDDARDAAAAYERMRGSTRADPDVNRAALQLADVLAALTATAHYDTAAEKAAATLALDLMARAGVDPRAALDAWRKVARAGGASPPGFLALHPAGAEQIAAIEAQLPLVLPVYDEVVAGRTPREPRPPMPVGGTPDPPMRH